MRPSGTRRLLAALPLLLGACWYGFVGGGLPAHIGTVAVLPFDNETSSPELQQELTAELRRELERRLGLRSADESRADAIIRGTIVRYETDVPIAYSADPAQATTARRRLQLTVDAEIVDQTNGRILWQRRGLVAEGVYDERSESEGRQRAIERVVNDIIEGAQSQW